MNCSRTDEQNNSIERALDRVIILLFFDVRGRKVFACVLLGVQSLMTCGLSCQKPSDTRQCCYKLFRISLAPCNLLLHGKGSFETLILWAVFSSLDKGENFQLSEILRPRVKIFVSACGFVGLACSTVRFTATASTVDGQFTVFPKLGFIKKSATLLNMIKTCKKGRATTAPVGPWMERVFRCIVKHSSLQT